MAEVIPFPNDQEVVIVDANEVTQYVHEQTGLPEDVILTVIYFEQQYILSKVPK